MLKRNLKDIVSVALLVAAAVVLIIFDFVDITYTADEIADGLINEIIPRAVTGVIITAIIAVIGERSVLLPNLKRVPRDILWCLPCFLVVLANFPFTALIGGTAEVARVDLIWLLIIKCLLVGLMEESLFRGLLLPVIGGYFKGKKYSSILTVAVTSAIFGLFHLLNLFAGAGIGATLMQVGYSFLIGAMLSAVLLKTGNLWLCVLIHAAFNIGGDLVPVLGSGTFQDLGFWIFTAAAGVICTAYILYYLIKKDRSQIENGSQTE